MNRISCSVSIVLFFIVTSSFAQSNWRILPNVPPVGNGRYEDIYFVNERIGWCVNRGGAILNTTNGGVSWTTQYTNSQILFRSVAFMDSLTGWAGSLGGHLLHTTNGGQTWTRIDTLINPRPAGVCDLSVAGDSVIVGSGRWNGPAAVIRSANRGTTWSYIPMSFYASLLIGCKFFTKDSGFVVGASSVSTEGGIVLFTSDGGTTWQVRHRTMRRYEHIWNIVFITPTIGYATVQNPYIPDTMFIIKTTDGGGMWEREKIGPSPYYAESIGFATELKGWQASGAGQGMYETTDGGTTWRFLSIGSRIHGMQILNDSIGYACGASIYKYSPDSAVVSVPTELSLPTLHRLEQNYPNPFNATTHIRYSLNLPTQVWLSVYTINGGLVHTLQHSYQPPGDYTIEWDARKGASGTYIYSMRTDEGILYRKAVLIK